MISWCYGALNFSPALLGTAGAIYAQRVPLAIPGFPATERNFGVVVSDYRELAHNLAVAMARRVSWRPNAEQRAELLEASETERDRLVRLFSVELEIDVLGQLARCPFSSHDDVEAINKRRDALTDEVRRARDPEAPTCQHVAQPSYRTRADGFSQLVKLYEGRLAAAEARANRVGPYKADTARKGSDAARHAVEQLGLVSVGHTKTVHDNAQRVLRRNGLATDEKIYDYCAIAQAAVLALRNQPHVPEAFGELGTYGFVLLPEILYVSKAA